MSNPWTCQSGHHWIPDQTNTPTECPYCGSTSIYADSVSDADNSDQTLERPSQTPSRHSTQQSPGSQDETLAKPASKTPQPAKPDIPPSQVNLFEETWERPALPKSTDSAGPHVDLESETLAKEASPKDVPQETNKSTENSTEIPPTDETLQKPKIADSQVTDIENFSQSAEPGDSDDDTIQRDHAIVPRQMEPPKLPQVAGFEILKQIGRGGMGVVYKARQLSVNRPVALKMMLGGAHASRQDWMRFQVEAEAIARLQHPNIVQLFESGKQAEVPYFALEYVEGGTLQGRLTRETMSPRDAAQMMLTLARAVAHAHQKGIIHRDLKPSNILLTKDGQPKITDFGLAKELDSEGHTGTGDILGTPNYMAPEQAEGRIQDIGTATDVYALGAIFYDMLTGQPPFRGATAMDTLQQVMFADPVPPVKLRPEVPRDPEIICLKCLEKSPPKRYHTAESLAEDLERYLNDQPILARPVSAWERTLKWAKRRPTLASLVLVSLLAVVLLSVGGYVSANREHTLREEIEDKWEYALEQEKLAKKEKAQAEAHFKLARQAVEKMHTRVAEEKLINQPRMSKVRRDLLKNALEFYLVFLKYRGDDPVILLEVARAHENVGDIQAQLGETEKAITAYKDARNLLVKLQTDQPANKKLQLTLGSVWGRLGVMFHEAQSPKDSEQAFRTSLKILTKLERESAKTPEYSYVLAKVYNDWANFLYLVKNDSPQAEKAFREAMSRLNKLDSQASRVEYQSHLARAGGNLSSILMQTKPDEAAKFAGQSLSANKMLHKRYPDIPDYRKELGLTYLNLAEYAKRKNRKDMAQDYLKEAFRHLLYLNEHFPNKLDHQHLLAVAYMNRYLYAKDTSLTQESLQDLQRSIQLWQTLVKQNSDRPEFAEHLAILLVDQSRFSQNLADLPKAEREAKEAIDVLTKWNKTDPKNPQYGLVLAKAQLQLGDIHVVQSKPEQAKQAYEQAVQVLEQVTTKDKDQTLDKWTVRINTQVNWAGVLENEKQPQEAAKHWGQIQTLLQSKVDNNPSDAEGWQNLAMCIEKLGSLAINAKQPETAEKHFAAAVRAQSKAIRLLPRQKLPRTDFARYAYQLLATLLQQKKYQDISKTISDVSGQLPKSADQPVKLAETLAKCVPIIQEDSNLSEKEREKLTEDFGAKAVQYLRQAVKQGYVDKNHILNGEEFEPIRKRDDFRKMVKELINPD